MMPPFQGVQIPLQAPPPSFAQKAVIAINVGGTVFQTLASTLCRADQGSILANLLSAPKISLKNEEPLFFDRDPDIFAALLSILRTSKKYPSTDELFSVDELIAEAEYYGVTSALKKAMAAPSLEGLDMTEKLVLVPSGRDIPSALSVGEDGSLMFSHGSKISVYDWALRKRSTVLTQFNCIDTLTRVSSSIAVTGAVDFPGLHVYDVSRKIHRATLRWEMESPEIRLHEPTVLASEFSPSKNMIFTSFESGRKNAHTILLTDAESFRPVAEIGRQIGSAVNLEPPATKLQWVEAHNLLMSSSVNGGPFGYMGVLKLWDVRSQKVVWECRESNPRPNGHQVKSDPSGDCFADVAVSEKFGSIFKVGVRDGGLFMADLRQLNNSPWVGLGDSNPGPGGVQNRVLGYGKQVFVSRGGDLEAWCEVGLREKNGGVFRKNVVGSKQGGERILKMATGGNRVFVTRKGLQGVEVWESSR